MFEVSTVTIQRWIRDGSIAAMKMPGKTGAYVIPRSEVERIQRERGDRRDDAEALLTESEASA